MSGLYFKLERKFGHLGIHGLVRIFAFFRLFIWVLSLANPSFVELLEFDRSKILGGEVWRIFSFLGVPAAGMGTFSIFYVLIELMFLFFIGDGLEQAWGPFGVTCYLFGAVICGAVLAIVGPMVLSDQINQMMVQATLPPVSSMAIIASLVMAFACLYPNVEILLFLVIPVKMRWIGLIAGAGLLLQFLRFLAPMPVLLTYGLPFIGMLLPFILVFVPGLIRSMQQKGKVASRQSKFDQGKSPETEAFHRCEQCGVTEVSQPDREFRIAADGEEYCSECKLSGS